LVGDFKSDRGFLGCETVYCCGRMSKFRRIVTMNTVRSPEAWYRTTTLYGTKTQKTRSENLKLKISTAITFFVFLEGTLVSATLKRSSYFSTLFGYIYIASRPEHIYKHMIHFKRKPNILFRTVFLCITILSVFTITSSCIKYYKNVHGY